MPSKIDLPFGLGGRPDDHDERDYKYSRAPMAMAVLDRPVLVDNRHLFDHVPIFDQGKEGACVGMGIATVMGLGSTTRSPRWAYEKAKLCDEWPGEHYQGTSSRAGLEAAQDEGTCSWDHWPFRAFNTSGLQPGASQDAASHMLPRYERLNTFQEVLHALSGPDYGYCVATLNVHTGWIRPTSKYRIRYSRRYVRRGYHFVVLVGYDEQAGYFLLRNSWGADWGDNGHAWLKFDDYHANKSDAWLPVLNA